MSKKLAAVLLVAGYCLLNAPAFAHSLRAQIDEAVAKWEENFNKGDAAALAASYTPDAAVLPPGGARVDGRADIQAFWQGAMDAGVSDVDLQTVEVSAVGGVAVEVGTFTLMAPGENGGKVTVKGKYLVTYHRGDDGAWLLHRDMYNYDPPATGE